MIWIDIKTYMYKKDIWLNVLEEYRLNWTKLKQIGMHKCLRFRQKKNPVRKPKDVHHSITIVEDITGHYVQCNVMQTFKFVY